MLWCWSTCVCCVFIPLSDKSVKEIMETFTRFIFHQYNPTMRLMYLCYCIFNSLTIASPYCRMCLESQCYLQLSFHPRFPNISGLKFAHVMMSATKPDCSEAIAFIAFVPQYVSMSAHILICYVALVTNCIFVRFCLKQLHFHFNCRVRTTLIHESSLILLR